MKPERYLFTKYGQLALLAVALLCLAPSIGVAGGPATWSALIEELKAHNPNLAELGNKVARLKELPSARMAWDDPVVSAGLVNVPADSYRFDQEGMTQKIIGVTQRIPSLMKRSADRQAALADVSVTKSARNLLTAQLIRDLRETVYEIVFLERSLEILGENELILDEFIEIANAKYSVGKGVQAHVIQAQLERGKLIDKRLILTEKMRLAKVRATRLLGRNPTDKFIRPQAQTRPGRYEYGKLWERARAASPWLALARESVQRARARLGQAQGLLGMNTTLSFQYGQRDDEPVSRADMMTVKAGVSLPLWRSGKQDKFIASARFGVREEASALDATTLDVQSKLKQAVISYNKETDDIELFRTGLIPQATQAVESASEAYKLDKLDFLTLLYNEISLLNVELDMEKSVLRRRNLYARIAALTGADTARGDNHE